jgi:DNA-binding transcriptional LysR family regulator
MIGVKLFQRNKRSVELTNAGVAFLKEAEEIVKKYEMAFENARKADAGLIGSLEIGFLVAPVRNFLPRVIRRFAQKYPKVEIRLNHSTTAHLNDALNTAELDIVFTVSLGLQNIGGLEWKTLFTESPSVFLHYEHPLAQKKNLKVSDLAQERFIMRDREESPQWYDHMLFLCAKNGFSPRVVSQTRRIEAVLMLVDAGMGITVLPKYLDMYAPKTLRVIEIEDEKDTLEVVVYWQKANKNPSIPLFLNVLETMMSEEYIETSSYGKVCKIDKDAVRSASCSRPSS